MHPYHKHLAHIDTSIRQALELLDQLASDAIIFLVDDENKLLNSFSLILSSFNKGNII